MSIKIENGPLYDAALTVSAMNEIELEGVEWIETSRTRKISFRRNYSTGQITILVFGLPMDIPDDVFEDLLDNAIKWDIKKDRTTMVKTTTRNWLVHYRDRDVVA